MFISCMTVNSILNDGCELLMNINIDAIVYVRDDPQTGHAIIKLVDGQTVETSENIIEIMSKIEVEKCRELKRTGE